MRFKATRPFLGGGKGGESVEGATTNIEEEKSAFVAVRDLFKYESRILSFDAEKENNGEDARKRNYEMDDGALFGASRQWGSIRAKINAEVFNNNETTSRENGRKLFLFVRHGEAAHNVWGERQKGEAPMPMEMRRQLVADLWSCTHPNVDPNGRAVLSVWAAEDLENPFR